MNLKITEAIKTKSTLKVTYKGGMRFVEPFCYGIGKSGKEFLRAWQVSGFSNHPNDMPNWRLFIVDDMSSVEVTMEHFEGSRPFYNPNDSIMTHIYCHV